MARKIHTVKENDKEAKVYWNSEVKEYRVSFYLNGNKLYCADYFTSDKEDAIDTANHWVK